MYRQELVFTQTRKLYCDHPRFAFYYILNLYGFLFLTVFFLNYFNYSRMDFQLAQKLLIIKKVHV